MPNWCEGNLRIRGTIKQIREFMHLAVDVDDIKRYIESDIALDIYLKRGATWILGSQRAFIMGEICIKANSSREKKSAALAYRSAGNAEPAILLALARASGVDIKLYAFERGSQFNRNIEIIGGKLVKDETIKFDDYDWECVCPLIGG